jgi:hypothetical protein
MRELARGVKLGAMQPLRVWNHPLEYAEVSKTDMLIGQLKTCDTLPHPHVASVEPPCSEMAHFEKNIQDALCNVIEHII